MTHISFTTLGNTSVKNVAYAYFSFISTVWQLLCKEQALCRFISEQFDTYQTMEIASAISQEQFVSILVLKDKVLCLCKLLYLCKVSLESSCCIVKMPPEKNVCLYYHSPPPLVAGKLKPTYISCTSVCFSFIIPHTSTLLSHVFYSVGSSVISLKITISELPSAFEVSSKQVYNSWQTQGLFPHLLAQGVTLYYRI